jgi:hypothetical protein
MSKNTDPLKHDPIQYVSNKPVSALAKLIWLWVARWGPGYYSQKGLSLQFACCEQSVNHAFAQLKAHKMLNEDRAPNGRPHWYAPRRP